MIAMLQVIASPGARIDGSTTAFYVRVVPVPIARKENDGVLRYMAREADPSQVSIVRPPPDLDIWRLGAHPDIVEQLWTRLNAALPRDCRFLVADTAALVDPESGLILALALGTQYALRLSGQGLVAALEAGHETSHDFATVGRTLHLATTFGPGWVFGRYDPRELEWLPETVSEAATSS